MAIVGLNYSVLRHLRQQKVLPEGSDLIELGESNWYGDVPLGDLARDIEAFVPDQSRRAALIDELNSITSADERGLYRIAKIYFEGIGGCATYESIDPGEKGSTYKLDLNHPVNLPKTYDVLVNYGTGEHVFNVFQFYKTAHDLTKPGGIMVHTAPMTGWIDHGFYNFQPTFFIDLAIANRYEVLLIVIGTIEPFTMLQIKSREHIIELATAGQIPANAMIDVAFRKSKDPRDFVAPIQGYYAGALSDEARKGWETLR